MRNMLKLIKVINILHFPVIYFGNDFNSWFHFTPDHSPLPNLNEEHNLSKNQSPLFKFNDFLKIFLHIVFFILLTLAFLYCLFGYVSLKNQLNALNVGNRQLQTR